MKVKKQIKLFIGFFALLILFASVIILINKMVYVKAEETTSDNDYIFTEVFNEKGEKEYEVSLTLVARLNAEEIFVPDSYQGYPVTQIAKDGFESCSNLTFVYLPSSIESIGNYAFADCAKLEYISMPNVKSIGNNAFALCDSLEDLYFPESIVSVGSGILELNDNNIYIHRSADEVAALWDSDWDNYFTGETVYDADLGDLLKYNAVYNSEQRLIGYEIQAHQKLGAADEDIIIYNCAKTELNPDEYLPVFNIASEAFRGTSIKSLTIRDRHTDDPSVESFNHSVNICSDAFRNTRVATVNIETPISFENVGENTKSTQIFYSSTNLQSVTLPEGLEEIPTEAFYFCKSLKEIKIGKNAEINELTGIKRIGDRAFAGCFALENITIPSTVTEMGSHAFREWGGTDNHQTVAIDFYEDELPASWNADWNGSLNSNVEITYKSLVPVEIHLNDSEDTVIFLQVKPGRLLPEINKPEIYGYIFGGIFDKPDGRGNQYYSESAEPIRIWNEEDSHDLYSYNIPHKSLVTIGNETYTISFGDDLPAVGMPEFKVGYDFYGYYIEENEIKTYYYDKNMKGLRTWDRIDEEIILSVDLRLHHYNITFILQDNRGFDNHNPVTYTIDDDFDFEHIFDLDKGERVSWSPAGVDKGNYDDIFVIGTWEPITTQIKYSLNGGTNSSLNPSSIKYNDPPFILVPATRIGYIFEGWYLLDEKKDDLNKRIEDSITLEARWDTRIDASIYTLDRNLQVLDLSTHRVGSRIILSLPSANFYMPCNIIIPDNIQQVHIFSSTFNNYDLYITINSRNTDLDLYLENFAMCAPLKPTSSNTAVAYDTIFMQDTENSGALNLYSYGTVTIHGSTVQPVYGYSYKGSYAINCKKWNIFAADNLSLYGGYGTKGSSNAVYCEPEYIPESLEENVKIYN